MDVAALRQVILRKKSRTSAGLDGVSIADLVAMPDSVLHFFAGFSTQLKAKAFGLRR